MHDIHRNFRQSTHLKVISAVLVVATIGMGAYAYRQRVWADKLHAQLVQTNQDDVKLMNNLTRIQKVELSRQFRKQGESRIADWIIDQ